MLYGHCSGDSDVKKSNGTGHCTGGGTGHCTGDEGKKTVKKGGGTGHCSGDEGGGGTGHCY